VRRKGRRSLGADDLLEAGRLDRLAGLPGRCFTLSTEVHAAYLLVHGFVQHAPFPRTYSLLTVVGDLLDLSSAAAGERPLDAESVHPWISGEMRSAEVASALRLCARLGAGEVPEADPLLSRILARTLSPAYQERLVLKALVPLSDEFRAASFARVVAGKLLPSKSHLDKVYGPRSTGWGRLTRRIRRPLDLLLRTWRSLRPIEIEEEIRENDRSTNETRGVPR
jgi:hypothetical protein